MISRLARPTLGQTAPPDKTHNAPKTLQTAKKPLRKVRISALPPKIAVHQKAKKVDQAPEKGERETATKAQKSAEIDPQQDADPLAETENPGQTAEYFQAETEAGKSKEIEDPKTAVQKQAAPETGQKRG